MQGDIELRFLGPGEAVVLDNVRPETFDNPIVAREAKAFLASDLNLIVVARSRGQVIGMATGVSMLHPDKRAMFFVNEVGVHSDFQRRGIGRALMEALLARVRAGGTRDIWLATEAGNVAARALYRSMGARETKGIVVYDWGHAMGEDHG